jgi:hypothetical protein
MKVVSQFEYAIMEAAGMDLKGVRPETNEEKQKRLSDKAKEFASRIKVKS